MIWYKSSYSNPTGNCVEAAEADNGDILLRDSKDQKGAPLTFTPTEMDCFLRGVKDGQFDRYILPDELSDAARQVATQQPHPPLTQTI